MLAEHANTVSPVATTVGVATLVLILGWNRLVPRVPGYIVALLGSLAVVALTNLPVETIGTRFGGIPRGLAPVGSAALPSGFGARSAAAGDHRCDAGRD